MSLVHIVAYFDSKEIDNERSINSGLTKSSLLAKKNPGHGFTRKPVYISYIRNNRCQMRITLEISSSKAWT